MKKIKYALVFALITLPLFSLFYKSHFMSLLPKAPAHSWILELSHNRETKTLNSKQALINSFELPIPTSSTSQNVIYLKLSPQKTDSKSDSKSNSKINSGIDSKSDSKTNSGIDSKSKSESKSESKSKSDSKSDSKTNSRIDSKSESKSKSKSKSDSKTNSRIDSKSKSKSESDSKTNSRIDSKSKSESESKSKQTSAKALSLTAHLRLYGQSEIPRPTNKKLTSDEIKKYTFLPELESDIKNQLVEISDSIIFPNDSTLEKLKKIFFYISDELILQPKNSRLSDVLTLKSGSYLGQARLLTALARINKIPARVSFGVQILKPDQKNTNRYIRVFYSEAFLKGRWVPINPHQKEFGVLKSDFMILHHDSENFAKNFNDRNLLSIYIKPLTYGDFNSNDYLKTIASKNLFWSTVSLHRFPLSIQSIFFGLLLIPFGTVILSLMRVVVGVETFGIFTPILLTLFFLETSLTFGLTFFILVVLLGLSQRALLDRFYLLAVPRLSVLLALVILMYTAFALFMDNFGLLSSGRDSLNYFPIVIITVFIERFSIYFIEEGAINTLKTTLGTFVVSILCYFLLSITWLKALLFNNPELILLAIGFNLILGSYKGYRFLEFIRFSELRRI